MRAITIMAILFALAACGGRGEKKTEVTDTTDSVELNFSHTDGVYKMSDLDRACHTTQTVADTVKCGETENLFPPQEPVLEFEEFHKEDIVVTPPELKLVEFVEPYEPEPRTVPYRDVTIEAIGDEGNIEAEIYYYSPRMDRMNYSYRKELGSDNNFIDLIKFKTTVSVPDTCEPGAKLMLRKIGYETVDIPMDSIGDSVTVRMTPKNYECTVYLEEEELGHGFSAINASVFHETPSMVFYGECFPGNFFDMDYKAPYCGSGCMVCYPEFTLFKRSEVSRGSEIKGGYKDLYKSLKRGEKCSFVISVDNGEVSDIRTEEFPLKGLDTFREEMMTQKWRLYGRQGTFQFRVRFVTGPMPLPERGEIGIYEPYGSVDDGENLNPHEFTALINNGIFVLRQIKPRLERVFNDCLSDSTTVIVPERTDKCLFLFSGLGEYYNSGPIKDANNGETIEMTPGRRFDFLYGEVGYTFEAEGETDKTDEGHIKNYTLSFGITDEQRRQTLVAHDRTEDAVAKILFIGDIDGDDVPDVILDATHHYEFKRIQLFLSGTKQKEELLHFETEYAAWQDC
jgi:hypothetical protein